MRSAKGRYQAMPTRTMMLKCVMQMVWLCAAVASTLVAAAPNLQTGTEQWSVAYLRPCLQNSSAPPVSSPGHDLVAYCGRSYGLLTGTYQRDIGSIELWAWLPNDRGLSQGQDGGLVLGALDGHAVESRDKGGMVLALALSSDQSQVASIELLPDGVAMLMIRQMPSLRRIRAQPLGSLGFSMSAPVVGFLPDKRLLYTRPGSPMQIEILSLEGRSEPLPGGTEAYAATLSPRGDVLALYIGGRSVRIVSLPEGKLRDSILLEEGIMTEVVQLALGAMGTPLVVTGNRVRIYDLKTSPKGRGYRLTTTLPADVNPGRPVVGAGSEIFFAGRNLAALRKPSEDARSAPTPRLPYPATEPAGFAFSVHPSAGTFMPPSLALQRRDDRQTVLHIESYDQRLFGPSGGDARTFGQLAAHYFSGDEATPGILAQSLRSWQGPGGRAAEYLLPAAATPEGPCAGDRYVRVQESDGALVYAVLRTQAGTEPAQVGFLLKELLDRPLGQPPSERMLQRTKKAATPCLQ